MPKRKARLSRAEEAEYLICLQELQAEGISNVEIPAEWRAHSRTPDIEITASPESQVFESPSGQPYYALLMRLVARRPVTVVDFQGTVSWDDDLYFGEVPEQNGICLFGSEKYPRKEVLNSRISNGLRFYRRGQMVEGWILAGGLERIPKKYKTHAIVPCQLSFRDPLGQELVVSAELSVLRTSKPTVLRTCKLKDARKRPGTLCDPGIGYAGTPQGSADTPARNPLSINPEVGSVSAGNDDVGKDG